jgi:hypothetical protein
MQNFPRSHLLFILKMRSYRTWSNLQFWDLKIFKITEDRGANSFGKLFLICTANKNPLPPYASEYNALQRKGRIKFR